MESFLLGATEDGMKPAIFRKDETTRNFGDELNLLLWSKFLPNLDKAGPGLLYGIGTMLHEPFTEERPVIVFGSGAGYAPPPDMAGIDVRFLRGPKSASVFRWKYPWLTDPAILVKHIMPCSPLNKSIKYGFMPHWTTIQQDPGMTDRLAEVGITVIDPLGPVWTTLHAIQSCEHLISEALHGAVVADTLRVPWVPAYLTPNHFFKWFDWTQSMDVLFNPIDLNVCPVTWAIEQDWCFHLSKQEDLDYKLERIDEKMTELQYDIELGDIR